MYASLIEDTISLADLGIPEVANGFGVCEGESWLGLDNQQGAQIAGSRESVCWKPAWRGQETLGESRNKLIGPSSIGGDGTRTWYKDKI